MSFVLEALRDKPLGLWLADDASPFRDYSGYNRNGSGTVAPYISLVSGAVQSSLVTTASFDSPLFIQGKESQSFSLEAWVYPTASGEQQILGHAGQSDGLLVDGSRISFVTKYLNSGEARASFDVQSPRAVHVVGVHTEEKNSLYIDGELVAEISVTEEQLSDQYVVTDGTLSSSNICINGIAIYATPLNTKSVLRHYLAGKEAIGNDTPVMYGGQRIPLSYDIANVFLSHTYTLSEDWESGMLNNLVVENDTLVPQIINDVSMSGEWLTALDLYDGPANDPVHSVSIFWDGEGASVEASLDGTEWVPVNRGEPLSIIPTGFVPSESDLEIRVRFPGGIEDDDSFLDNLTVVGIKTDTSDYLGNKIRLYRPASLRQDYPATELRSNWGAYLYSGGALYITTPQPVKTVELWVKGGTSFSTNISTATEYTNGGTARSINSDEWQMQTYVVDSGITDISLSGNAQVGQVVVYPDALTPEQVADVYTSYSGKPLFKVEDESVISLTESSPEVEIYAYDWAIESAG